MVGKQAGRRRARTLEGSSSGSPREGRRCRGLQREVARTGLLLSSANPPTVQKTSTQAGGRGRRVFSDRKERSTGSRSGRPRRFLQEDTPSSFWGLLGSDAGRSHWAGWRKETIPRDILPLSPPICKLGAQQGWESSVAPSQFLKGSPQLWEGPPPALPPLDKPHQSSRTC